jgi:hypothetical protein
MSRPPSVVGAVRGRGAKSNHSGRYESAQREDFDDGWTLEDPQPQQLRTSLTAERARTILARNDSPDIGFDRSINPYRGCEHGCLSCQVTHTPIRQRASCQPPKCGAGLRLHTFGARRYA